jgi:hypothetical protein
VGTSCLKSTIIDFTPPSMAPFSSACSWLFAIKSLEKIFHVLLCFSVLVLLISGGPS